MIMIIIIGAKEKRAKWLDSKLLEKSLGLLELYLGKATA